MSCFVPLFASSAVNLREEPEKLVRVGEGKQDLPYTEPAE